MSYRTFCSYFRCQSQVLFFLSLLWFFNPSLSVAQNCSETDFSSQLERSSGPVIPLSAEVASFEITQYPLARINGKDVILPPGVRIFDAFNRIVLPINLAGIYFVKVQNGPYQLPQKIWIMCKQ